jgi:hypothetical protein
MARAGTARRSTDQQPSFSFGVGMPHPERTSVSRACLGRARRGRRRPTSATRRHHDCDPRSHRCIHGALHRTAVAARPASHFCMMRETACPRRRQTVCCMPRGWHCWCETAISSTRLMDRRQLRRRTAGTAAGRVRRCPASTARIRIGTVDARVSAAWRNMILPPAGHADPRRSMGGPATALVWANPRRHPVSRHLVGHPDQSRVSDAWQSWLAAHAGAVACGAAATFSALPSRHRGTSR